MIAELEQTVETVTAAVDAAAARILETAEAEAKRRTEDAAERIETLANARLEPMRRMSEALVERATELDGEIARLSDEARAAAATLRAPDPPTAAAPPAQDAPAPEPTNNPSPEPSDDSPEYSGTTLDDVDRARASLNDAGATLRRFRRRRSATDEVPEGVRVVVGQMRLAGEPDSAIARYLEQMGVEDPAAVISRLES